MLTTWSYYQRWGRHSRGEPLQPVAVYRSARGEYQFGHDGRWTTISQPHTPLDQDTMYDLIPETEALALVSGVGWRGTR